MSGYNTGMNDTVLPFELHTHTLASGHGTGDTIADLAKAAAARGMKALGISDHGPATPGAARESYFRGLKNAPAYRAGIRIFYGVEANILDEEGRLDLPQEVLTGLDFCIAGIHPQSYRSSAYGRKSFWDRHQVRKDQDAAQAIQTNTRAYIKAMEHPCVKFIAHPEDQNYPVDVKALVEAAVHNQVYLEINEASLAPEGYRGDTRATMREILLRCKEYRHPILCSSDSHGAEGVGRTPLCLELIRECGFPRDLILNDSPIPKVGWMPGTEDES